MPLVQTRGAASAQGFGEFAQAAVAANYIEEVFSTYLYTGNNTTNNIVNNIDLSTKGGLVWGKARNIAGNHYLVDTARGAPYGIRTATTGAQTTSSSIQDVTAFNSNGFSLGIGNQSSINNSGEPTVSWTFREQPKFFDVVTYTGNATNRTIAHSLGSVPGCIIVKRTDAAADWAVYHRSLANTDYLTLNTTAAAATGATWWNSTTPTSAVFSVGTDASVNASGGTYVAYIFAHDAGGFGLAGTDNVISCGSYTGTGAIGNTITLGYEPQWIMIKASSGTSASYQDWYIYDNMRGIFTDTSTNDPRLMANLSSAESSYPEIAVSATGFVCEATGSRLNESGTTYVYIACRRGPMKVPTDATKVFAPIVYAGDGGASRTITGASFPPDLSITKSRNATNRPVWFDRLRGAFKLIQSNDTAAEFNDTSTLSSFNMNGISIADTGQTSFDMNFSGTNYIDWMMGRAPSFFDEVCYTGTGSATTFSHNLTVVPEMMIVKRRSTANDWAVYANNDNTDYLVLNTTAATADDNTYWNDTSPTSSVFSVGTNNAVNASASTYVAYLFATCPGVSKVGSYTGNATLTTINCGFTGGARFVLIKRTDTTGAWYVWDTARGMTSGTDASLRLNTANVESNADSVYTITSGFQLLASPAVDVNTSSGTYIFLAIA